MPQMIIANRLRDGLVVFLAPDERWDGAIGGGVVHSLPPAFCEAPHAFRTYDIVDGAEPAVTDHALDV